MKVASPGIPDYYQGTELWDFSLVDPDNRRPVDYALRRRLLEQTDTHEGLLDDLSDGKAKLYVIRKGLELRRQLPALFHGARYEPLYADAGREENLCAFALRSGTQAVVAVAPRLFARLMQPDELAPLGERFWGDSVIKPNIDGELVDVLTGERHAGGELRLASLLSSFPVALLRVRSN